MHRICDSYDVNEVPAELADFVHRVPTDVLKALVAPYPKRERWERMVREYLLARADKNQSTAPREPNNGARMGRRYETRIDGYTGTVKRLKKLSGRPSKTVMVRFDCETGQQASEVLRRFALREVRGG